MTEEKVQSYKSVNRKTVVKV